MNVTSVLNLDYEIFTWLDGLAGKTAWGDLLAVILAQGVIFLLIAGLAVFTLLHSRKYAYRALEALAAGIFSRAVVIEIIRLYVERPRPFAHNVVSVLIPEPLDASFPSTHTSIMFALGFSLLLINRRWGIAYLILAFFSAVARIVVGVHFPLDVFVGILVGLISALTLRLFVSYWQNKDLTQK